MPPVRTVFTLLIVLLLGPPTAVHGGGKVRILFLGEVAASNQLFLDWIDGEPRFQMIKVPCDLEWLTVDEAKRFARIYLPRTKSNLVEGYDVAVFEDFTPDVLPDPILHWFQEGIFDGMGIALIEFAYWGGSNEMIKWMDLSFYDVFPADVYLNVFPAGAGRTYYVLRNEGGPLDIPGIESVPMNRGYHGDLGPRPGATVEAIWRGRKRPAMVTSTYGEGRTLQLDHGWDNIPDPTRASYDYLPEFIYNHVYCIAGIPYPEDLQLVHITRTSLLAYPDRKRGTLAVVEFVERFGADLSRVNRRLDTMDSDYGQAADLYLEGEYEASNEILASLLEQFTEVEADLMDAKDRAFLWIYLAEWASVAGVATLGGFALWTLMVRRRLYREVGTTRAG